MGLKDLDLINVDLRGVDLSQSDLSNSNLSGSILDNVDLREANLKGTVFVNSSLRRANMEGAELYETDLRGADLTEAIIDFEGLNNSYIYEDLLKLRNHGHIDRDNFKFAGFNSRLDEIQAIFLEKRLKTILSEFNPDIVYVHNTWFKASLGIFKIQCLVGP